MSHHESNARGHDARLVDRMLFFSDAVFAIVLTIMVLELHAPILEDKGLTEAASAQALWMAILGEGRTLFAYLISFAIVGLWWSVHMRVTRAMHYFDWPSAILNLVFMFTVTAIPFAASVLGDNITNNAAWALYWGVNSAASLTLTLLMFVVSRDGGRLIGGMGGRERAARLLQAVGPGIGFAIGVWGAANGIDMVSRFCWVIIMPISLLARFIFRQPKPHEAPAADA